MCSQSLMINKRQMNAGQVFNKQGAMEVSQNTLLSYFLDVPLLAAKDVIPESMLPLYYVNCDYNIG